MVQRKWPEWKAIHELSISDHEHPIRPDDVPLVGEASGSSTFGTAEIEEVAGHLIMFFKARGYWCSFTIDELIRYYDAHNWNHNLIFYGLMGGFVHVSGPFVSLYERTGPFLIADPYGKYYVTNLFIEQCCRNLKKKRVA